MGGIQWALASNTTRAFNSSGLVGNASDATTSTSSAPRYVAFPRCGYCRAVYIVVTALPQATWRQSPKRLLRDWVQAASLAPPLGWFLSRCL